MKKIAVAALAVAQSLPAPHPWRPAPSPHLASGASGSLVSAQQQIGKPYLWRPGLDPGVFTAWLLVMMAYQSAGISGPHTSQDQWATEPHVSNRNRGRVLRRRSQHRGRARQRDGGPNQMIQA